MRVGQKAPQPLPQATCKTSGTERSRASLHGAGAKTGAWTMEGRTTWCNKDSIPPESGVVQDFPTPGGPADDLQQRSLCRIMKLHGAPKKPLHLSAASDEAAPGGPVGCHTTLLSVAPARLFAQPEGNEMMASSQPRLLTCCFHTWDQEPCPAARRCQARGILSAHIQVTLSPVSCGVLLCGSTWFAEANISCR
jgi:hypothetical protein